MRDIDGALLDLRETVPGVLASAVRGIAGWWYE